jgi:predicted RNase H-like nuclease (RuvC/YqgF family)
LSVFAPLYYVFGQDAPQVRLLLEAVRKLENSDLLITNLKKDITSLRETIETLSSDKLQLQRNNKDLSRNNLRQLIELETALDSLRRQQEVSTSQSLEYRLTIERLSDLYDSTLKASAEKDVKISALKERGRIFLIWAMIATLAAMLPWLIKLLVRKI